VLKGRVKNPAFWRTGAELDPVNLLIASHPAHLQLLGIFSRAALF
jgi:hypothetical protein